MGDELSPAFRNGWHVAHLISGSKQMNPHGIDESWAQSEWNRGFDSGKQHLLLEFQLWKASTTVNSSKD